jgi:hypothetical protein
MREFLMNYNGVVLAWQFPKNNKGEKSELIEGLRITHQIYDGQQIYLHFKCKNANNARGCKKWRIEKGVVGDESLHLILRPAHTVAPVTANALRVQGRDIVPFLRDSAPAQAVLQPIQMHL